MAQHSKNKLLPVVGWIKVLEAIFFIALILGLRRVLQGDIAEHIHKVAEALRVDPDNQHINEWIGKATGLSHRRLNELSIATALYALLFAIEGVGLMFRKRWAEYVTVITTGGFLPIEIYEMFEKFSAVKAGVFVLNLAIVVYLIWNLWHTREKG